MNVIEKAQQRMMEEDRAGNDDAVIYWAAYIDGARAQKRETIEAWYEGCIDGRVKEMQDA